MKKVLVSGCYDLLHGGHIAFFKTAASYGRLYVSIGSDENLLALKGKKPFFSQEERLYIVSSVRYVEEAFIAGGSGFLDFEPDIERIEPDIFIVNTDGHSPEKEALSRDASHARLTATVIHPSPSKKTDTAQHEWCPF